MTQPTEKHCAQLQGTIKLHLSLSICSFQTLERKVIGIV